MRFTLAAAWLLIYAATANAEQKKSFGVYDAHYIILPTAMLKPEIAAQYGIVRSPTQALVNISLIERDGLPVVSEVTGDYRNLLEQTQPLTFREVREGEAIYYLATFRYTDRDVLRFTFTVRLPDGSNGVIEHQQRMHREDT